MVAGARTTTGKPILANDPHLELGAPILWYLARIVTPEGSVKGATVPGLPVVLLGQNESIAWGITTADTDTQDLFVETVDPANPQQYLTPDGPKPFETRDETIHVKDGARRRAAHPRDAARARCFPTSARNSRALAGPGKAIALAFTGLGDNDTTAEAMMRVNAAHNWDEFLAALRLYQTPTQNFVYADVSGDIGFISPGLVPDAQVGRRPRADRRRDGRDRLDRDGPVRTVAAAAQSADRLRLQRQQRQCRARPAAQVRAAIGRRRCARAASSNSSTRPTSTRWRRRRRCRPTGPRSRRWRLLPLLQTIKPSDERARQALQLLAGWNGVMDKDRPEPLIFNAFLSALHRILLIDKTGVDLERQRAVRRDDADLAGDGTSRMVRRARTSPTRTAARRCRGRSTTRSRCWSSATAPT